MQYAGSYVTTMLIKLPGVVNFQRLGYWNFAPENYQLGSWQTMNEQENGLTWRMGHAMEFEANAIKKGFLGMNLTLANGKL